jgi:cytochrome oxidase Cu insertion factor (SCO1/SenC/PrrC family)
MKSRTLTFWVAILFLFSGSMLFLFVSGRLGNRGDSHPRAAAQEISKNVDLKQAAETMEFQLTNQDGGVFDSKGLEGKVWVGSVFFSSCASTCRAQNMQVAKLQQKYGDRGVQFVSITCDPDKDTPETMKSYARMFGAEHDKWHFLTGDYDLIEKIGTDKFGITVQHQVHSDRLVLFDAEGNCQGAFRSTNVNQFQELEEALDKILAEQETAD